MRRLTLAASAALALATACGSDDEQRPVTPPPPPTLTLAALRPVGGAEWTPGSGSCVAPGSDPDGTIGVVVSLENFTLRPPGTCGSLSNCGRLLVRIDPGATDALRLEAATALVPVKMAPLGEGPHTFRVELLDRNGEAILGEDKQPLFSEVSVEVSVGCGASADAGTDAADAASDADTEAGADAASDAGDAGDDAASDAGDAGSDAASDAGDAGDAAAADAPSD